MATKATDAIPTDTLGKTYTLYTGAKILSFASFLKAKKEGLWYVIMKVYVRNRMAFLRAPAQTPTCLGCA